MNKNLRFWYKVYVPLSLDFGIKYMFHFLRLCLCQTRIYATKIQSFGSGTKCLALKNATQQGCGLSWYCTVVTIVINKLKVELPNSKFQEYKMDLYMINTHKI